MENSEQALRLLLVDDSEDDALLLLREMRRSGVAPCHRLVDSEDALVDALQRDVWDIVITDHNMPGFSSFQALKRTREVAGDIPVIIVSGAIGEELAVQAMKAGAQDYIMKDNLSRLVPAILREVRESQVRQARKVAEQNLEHMAYHDSLTDLVNRREFERRLGQSLRDARDTGREHVLLYLDLDQFKVINDTCGHTAGDELLKQVASLLSQHIRSSDTLARLGGDEFGILLSSCDLTHGQRLAQTLCEEVQDFRFVWKNQPFSVSLSIGLVLINQQCNSFSELLSHADLACYAAKDRGRNNVQIYEASDRDMQQRKSDMQWTSSIQSALNDGSFFLCHQPIVRLKSGSEDGIRTEFLVRMKQGANTVPPGAFIPAAERYNLMPRIDRLVVTMACQYLDRTGHGRADQGTYFINLSGNSLSDVGLFMHIQQEVRRFRIRPERLCFEVTETAAIGNLRLTIDFITQARQEGFQFALDDFGSGMSSFSYLKTLPVDYLKVDGGFVRNLLHDPIDLGIVDACNRVGHAAGLQTIAEFVEDEQTKARLLDLGLDFAQGYGIARPEVL